MRNFTHLIITIFFLFTGFFAFSQKDIDNILENELDNETTIVSATFKGTRLLNGHTVETRRKGVFEFLISHRFGRINSGVDELFGLDQSNIRFGFEYALTDNFTVALGRSSFEKTYDGYLKYKLLKQKEGNKNFPFTLTFLNSTTEETAKNYDPTIKLSFSNRLVYTNQLIVARKFNSKISLQVVPTFIHYNTVKTIEDANNLFAIGFGGRIKLNNRLAITGEYYYNTNPFQSLQVYNPIALGLEIETGGHVFQLIFTNAISMVEKGFISETTGNFFKGDIHFGFNVSRAF
ncbi:MAG TPA: hypothetical protein ENK67_07000 [Flavobacteriia bacterium]|nr:hypothetical protein [Flavobacteriia bacterium]